jgi:hypothetical protein
MEIVCMEKKELNGKKTRSQKPGSHRSETWIERDQQSINNRVLWSETGPPKLEVSICAEFVMGSGSVYANATFGVFISLHGHFSKKSFALEEDGGHPRKRIG